MTSITTNGSRPLSRRAVLKAGAFAVGNMGLADLLRLRARAGNRGSETAVILLWLRGGPPHMETYHLKPGAPSEYRGAFKAIPPVVPGVDVCEHLPLHAAIADKFTIVRSVAHEFADHGGG